MKKISTEHNNIETGHPERLIRETAYQNEQAKHEDTKQKRRLTTKTNKKKHTDPQKMNKNINKPPGEVSEQESQESL